MTLNSIIANFQTFKLVDLLDILVIAFLIYQLLGIVNRTRAGQLAKGALLVLVVYLVANILNMRTVTWLLNSLLQVGLLTLVVLFQPEIRRALERMGQTDQWAGKLFNMKGRPKPQRSLAQRHHCHLRCGRAFFRDQDRCPHRAGAAHQPLGDRPHRYAGEQCRQPGGAGHHLLRGYPPA